MFIAVRNVNKDVEYSNYVWWIRRRWWSLWSSSEFPCECCSWHPNKSCSENFGLKRRYSLLIFIVKKVGQCWLSNYLSSTTSCFYHSPSDQYAYFLFRENMLGGCRTFVLSHSHMHPLRKHSTEKTTITKWERAQGKKCLFIIKWVQFSVTKVVCGCVCVCVRWGVGVYGNGFRSVRFFFSKYFSTVATHLWKRFVFPSGTKFN